jgi:hypothetical protein
MKRLFTFLLFLLAVPAFSQPFSAQIEAARGRNKLFATTALPASCAPGTTVWDSTVQSLKVCANDGVTWNLVGSGSVVNASTPTSGCSSGGVLFSSAANTVTCSEALFTYDATIGVKLLTVSRLTLPILAMTPASGTMTVETSARVTQATHSYTWTFAQVNTALGAGTTGDVLVVGLPAKTEVVDAEIVITQGALGPNTLTVACGRVSATYIDYITAQDAKAAANTVYGDVVGERGTNLTGYDVPSYVSSTDVVCHFIAGNTTDLTAGTGRVVLTTRLLP